MVYAFVGSLWANRHLCSEVWPYCMLEMAFEPIWSGDCFLRDSDSVDSAVRDWDILTKGVERIRQAVRQNLMEKSPPCVDLFVADLSTKNHLRHSNIQSGRPL